MGISDIILLAVRNLREARLRSGLTAAGVAVGVAVVVTMVSFGLGLQRNTISRFKEIDLFNEISVFGRSLTNIVSNQDDPDVRGRPTARGETAPTPQRILDDAALAEIQKIEGVSSVEPVVSLTAYLRSNDHALLRVVGGTLVPPSGSRLKEFAAGAMISGATADEAVVNENFTRDFGFAKPADAVGQQIEFLAPPGDAEQDESLSFFGLPLEGEKESGQKEDDAAPRLAARAFRITGVFKEPGSDNSGNRRVRGLTPAASVYIPVAAAREWALKYRSAVNEVALQLARASGAVGVEENEGYNSATVRVSDPGVLTDVRRKLNELGFNTFSILDQIEQIRTFFLIINSVLALLGGISLLVASLGIANTMLMSIFERTREIGIMKAIGAEDREIKLIFFVEAAIIGLLGGIIGALAAAGLAALANKLVYEFVLKPRATAYVNFFDLPPALWLGAILFAIAVSVIAALYPAARAARIDPVKALREG